MIFSPIKKIFLICGLIATFLTGTNFFARPTIAANNPSVIIAQTNPPILPPAFPPPIVIPTPIAPGVGTCNRTIEINAGCCHAELYTNDKDCIAKVTKQTSCLDTSGKTMVKPLSNICTCDSEYVCSSVKDVGGSKLVEPKGNKCPTGDMAYYRIWTCSTNITPLRITLSSTPKNPVMIPQSSNSITATINWDIKPTNDIDYCEGPNKNGITEKLNGTKGTIDVLVRASPTGTPQNNPFYFKCFGKDGKTYSNSIIIRGCLEGTKDCSDDTSSPLLTTTSGYQEVPTAIEPTPNECYAPNQSIWALLFGGIDWLISAIIGLMAELFKWILGFIITGFMFALTPSTWQGFVDNPLVNGPAGLWPLARNFANIMLALGMIIMAIATIIRNKKYNYEAILGKLVLAALLVNFSLVICGIFIDISNYLTLYFLSAGGVTTLPNMILSTIDKVACSVQQATGKAEFIFDNTAGFVMALILAIVFIGQFVALLIYVIIRTLTLWFCLITSPLAFVLGVFPFGEGLFKKWQGMFTQAIVSLPVLAFSVWIIAVVINRICLLLKVEADAGTIGLPMLILYAVVIIMLAQSLIMIANSLKVSVIEKAYGTVTKGITGLMGAGAAALGKKSMDTAQRSSTWKKVATWGASSRFGMVRNMAIPMMKANETAEKKREENIKEELKYRGVSGDGKKLREVLNEQYKAKIHTPEWRSRTLEILNQLADESKGALLTEPEDRKTYLELKNIFGENNPTIKAIEDIMPSWKTMKEDRFEDTPDPNDIKEKIKNTIRDKSLTKESASKVGWYGYINDLEARGLAGDRARILGITPFSDVFTRLNGTQFGFILKSVKVNKRKEFYDKINLLYTQETGNVLEGANHAIGTFMTNTARGSLMNP